MSRRSRPLLVAPIRTLAERKSRTLVKKGAAVLGRPGQRIDIVLRVRHQADDVPALVADAGNVAKRSRWDCR